MPDDSVDRMIAAALAARGPDEPFYRTAARIFFLGAEGLTEAELTAFEVTGFEAIKTDGPPAEISVPATERMIEAGRPFSRAEIDEQERSRLALIGFLALAAEQAASPNGDESDA